MLLVDHNTGSGKTLLMLRILESYYQDGRPKIAIFPKECIQDDNHIVKVFFTIMLKANVKFYPALEQPVGAGAATARTA